MPATELVPRLSSAIRQFTNTGGRTSIDVEDLCVEHSLSKRQEFERTREASSAAIYWRRLLVAVASAGARRQLKRLQQLVLSLLGGEAPQPLVEEVTALVFEQLAGCEMLSNSQMTDLNVNIAGITKLQAEQLLQIIRDLTSEMSPEVVEGLLGANSSLNENGMDKMDSVPQEEFVFGVGLKLAPLVEHQWDDDAPLSDLSNFTRQDEGFSMNYNDVAANINSGKAALDDTPYGPRWVEKQLCSVGSADATDSLMPSVYNLLSSERSNDELQNELLDLLGFNSIGLISSFLSHRKEIIAARLSAPNPVLSAECLQRLSAAVRQSSRNLPGSSVVIQSQQEVDARKMLRREEKRIKRRVNTAQNNGIKEVDEEDYTFDPALARAHREAELLQAMRAPLFNERSRPAEPSQQLPFVFDSFSQAKQASAFVAGNKLSIPADSVWRETKMYQSVEIPASDPPPLDVGNERVAIQSLDHVGQLAFKGVTELNRIQSVVFNTAYHTNENLLICAPTGAGKTNIAMLTVVHQIRQNMENGAIKGSDFKIIYIAPMKALAAEMTANFSRRLQPLGISVKECTGDMQLSKQTIMATQMLVTTPEKWDVLSRKSTGDVSLTQLVKLIIIDEVHLLHGDRGPVVEALVARTIRQVESSQSMIRIVGLSATLPNYVDVAHFLRVNPMKGLFFFDGRFRPVPLGQRFVGVKAIGMSQQMNDMDVVCYEQAFEMVSKGHQVMVFVHARNATVRTAMLLREIGKKRNQLSFFRSEQSNRLGQAQRQVEKSKNKQLREMFDDGFSIHHAGMLRSDRSMVERFFTDGLIKVLCCTSTLAWGVNLPAHAVVIRGTDIYDAKHGSFVDLGVLDVMQIFGRAGRPQFDKFGHGTIITRHDKLSHYLSLLTNQFPIESSFISLLADNLNAEICLGTVATVEEAVEWLTYTYLYVRMRRNPLVYGIKPDELKDDPILSAKCHALIHDAAVRLDRALMIRYDLSTGYLCSTDQGRTASHYYVKYDTVEVINELINSSMGYRDILAMLSRSSEFEQIKVRDDELDELDRHIHEDCEEAVLGGSENVHGKVNILMQTYISRGRMDSFSLISDMNYIVQNATRICRALFELCVDKKWPLMAGRLLNCSLQLERRQWHSETPLRQCGDTLGYDILDKLESRNMTPEMVREMDMKELGLLIRNMRKASDIQRIAAEVPALILDASVQPITRRVLRVRLTVTADFRWNDRVHGSSSENFIVWVEDPENNFMYHSEYFAIQKKHVLHGEPQLLVFTIPIFEPMPTQYLIRVLSDRWLGSESVFPLSFQHLILPDRHPPHTNLLPLEPLPVSALQNIHFETLYSFSHFNAVQTQIFHALYHTDHNLLLGAPTGSGKTIAAEIAIFRVFNTKPRCKVVYIAPMKALVRERMKDWSLRLGHRLGRSVVELTGDVTPDVGAIQRADVIVTTPEKWDGISRSWQTRNYVQDVALIIIDEIHLLGEDRGPVLEVIVSRTNFISSHTKHVVRIVGLSTAMANAIDLAEWLGIKDVGLYNFRASVRPVPLEVHIQGFPGKHYCPRMSTMNKPCFKAIRTHSPQKPSLIFVSSRRQTRITALDLISYLAGEDNPKQWLHMDEHELDELVRDVRDQNLRLTLAFGIGIHHAGLAEYDRKLVEGLFVDQRIQVLIATATLAWGVNFPAHLVIVKGTEYYDGKQKRYVDFPVTDVLQMMGRAGRPQFDDQGVAVVLVHDVKKHFYKHFLYEPFPVESSLLDVLPDHLNAEIVAGTLRTKQEAMDYLTWTFFFRRVLQNPSYYGLEKIEGDAVNTFLSSVVDRCVVTLVDSGCVEIDVDGRGLQPTVLGKLSSFYYISYKTMELFGSSLSAKSTLEQLLNVLSEAHEYHEIPVRHNEEITNGELAQLCPLAVNQLTLDSPHTKAHLLFQAHFSRLTLSVSDYLTDLKSVLDQAMRIVQAMLDLVAESGWLASTLRTVHVMQQIYQGRWVSDPDLLCLPHVERGTLPLFGDLDVLPAAAQAAGDPVSCRRLTDRLSSHLDGWQIEELVAVLRRLPLLTVSLAVEGWWESSAATEQRPLSKQQRATGPRPDSSWTELHADQSYSLRVQLSQLAGRRRGDGKAYTPRYQKPKQEGWLLVLGEPDSGELLAMRRVPPLRSSACSVHLQFRTPDVVGRRVFTVYVMSDCYLGLDQQYDVCFSVLPACLSAQINSELDT